MGSFLAMLDALLDESQVAGEAEVAEAMAEAQEKDYDRSAALAQGTMNPAEPGPEEDVVVVATDEGPVLIVEDAALHAARVASDGAKDEQAMIASFAMPSPREYRSRGERYQLIFNGSCSHCAHCGQPLTDAESIERGIGPVCSKKGYFEDPKEGVDEMQALISLAEFPDLMQYVTDVYKPQGARKMMNFLVKICALNRRSPVHLACTDAIECLGYKALASTLRESVAVIEVKPRQDDPDNYTVWVKKSEWNWQWTNALRALPGTRFPNRHSGERGTIVPKRHKAALWGLMNTYFTGFCAKVPRKDGTGQVTIRIRAKSLAETHDSTPPADPTSTSI